MDPNATLARLLELAEKLTWIDEPPALSPVDLAVAADELAQAVKDLDTWLGRGGALPARWAR